MTLMRENKLVLRWLLLYFWEAIKRFLHFQIPRSFPRIHYVDPLVHLQFHQLHHELPILPYGQQSWLEAKRILYSVACDCITEKGPMTKTIVKTTRTTTCRKSFSNVFSWRHSLRRRSWRDQKSSKPRSVSSNCTSNLRKRCFFCQEIKYVQLVWSNQNQILFTVYDRVERKNVINNHHNISTLLKLLHALFKLFN